MATTVNTRSHAGPRQRATGVPNPTRPASAVGSRAARVRKRAPQPDLSGLIDEAQAAVSSSANAMRGVRDRYRAAHQVQVDRWEKLRAKLARAGRQDGASSEELRREEAVAGREVGHERATLARLELTIRSLENAWLFLGREDESLVMDPASPPSAADAQMRVVEAQEAERSRLAREVHDGPAQALANGIFQLEIVERRLDRRETLLARSELRQLRDMLTRDLRGVRAYLSQLRPPLLADLGLSGAITDAAEQLGTTVGIPVAIELDEGLDQLPETTEIVILRVIQEALQNVRKHAEASSVRVRVTREGSAWAMEVRDDGKGFDPDAPADPGRRHFGLQFMRERSDLIGARFEVRSRRDLGTVIRMAIPSRAEESR